MNLTLEKPGTNYKNSSQKARVTTEPWVQKNLHCPNCGGTFSEFPPNTKTKDVVCKDCGEEYQIKSMQSKIATSLLGAEYNTTKKSLESGKHPSFILLQYSSTLWSVLNVQVIPRAFIMPSCLVARKRLEPPARRAGWQGCTFDLTLIPSGARINIVENGIIQDENKIKTMWKRAQAMLARKPEAREWIADVLRIVDLLPAEFELADAYRFEAELQTRHKNNHNIKPKIRQQLQILRDMGRLEFVGNGRYKKIS